MKAHILAPKRGNRHRKKFAPPLTLVCLALVCAVALLFALPASTQSLRGDGKGGVFVAGARGTEMVNGRAAAAGEVLVKFRRSAVEKGLSDVESLLDADQNVEVGGTGTRLVRSRSKDTATLLAELSNRSDVVYAEPNYVAYGGSVPNDAQFFEMWNMRKIGAETAWDVATGSRDVVVGVVDSGIDYNHPDLAANVWSAPAAFTVNINGQLINCPAGSHGFNAINNTCDPMDDNNHGTHVSGTIGATGNNSTGVAGVNWTTSVMAVKWLDANNRGFISDAIDAIEFTIQAKQQLGAGANVRVLNNSWFANNFVQAVGDAITRAQDHGILFVALAGNNSTDNDVIRRTPSGHNVPNVVGVASTDINDGLSSFSNWGRTSVHIGAPGSGVYSTLRNNSYGHFSGTSMATPHVAGAAALLLSRCSMTTAGVKGILLTNTDPVASLTDRTTTGGRLNVGRAINACASVPNVVEDARFFVRQHYVDFFSREPDPEGLAYWTNQITECGTNVGCIEVRRINVSAAFFVSTEFQQTGYLVYRFYQAAFNTGETLRIQDFLPDTQRIGRGVVVNVGAWQQTLEENKQAFATEFVARPAFTSRYPQTMSADAFIDALNTNTGGSLTVDERNSLVSRLNSSQISRAQALREVAEDADFAVRERNEAFVLMQYFGYMRRNPPDAPEETRDFTGYNFWLQKLNDHHGDYISAEMVKAFITSGEYRERFGQP